MTSAKTCRRIWNMSGKTGFSTRLQCLFFEVFLGRSEKNCWAVALPPPLLRPCRTCFAMGFPFAMWLATKNTHSEKNMRISSHTLAYKQWYLGYTPPHFFYLQHSLLSGNGSGISKNTANIFPNANLPYIPRYLETRLRFSHSMPDSLSLFFVAYYRSVQGQVNTSKRDSGYTVISWKQNTVYLLDDPNTVAFFLVHYCTTTKKNNERLSYCNSGLHARQHTR